MLNLKQIYIDFIGKEYVIFSEDWMFGTRIEYDMSKDHSTITVVKADYEFLYFTNRYGLHKININDGINHIITNYYRLKKYE
jgi:hypothetical protein